MVTPLYSATELAEDQALAESMMTLTLEPFAPAGRTPDDDPILAPQPRHRGKVQGGSQGGKDAQTRYVKVGGVELPVLSAGLHIPISAPVPDAGEQAGHGWEYVVVAVGPADDPALLNRRYRVVGVPVKSYATARRLDVIEV